MSDAREEKHEGILKLLYNLSRRPTGLKAAEIREVAAEAYEWMRTLMIDLRGHEALVAGYSKRTPGGEAVLTEAQCEAILAAQYAADAIETPRSWKATTIRASQAAALSTRPAGESADPLTPVERERVRQHQEYDQIATAVERRPPSDGPTLLSIVERLAPDPSARASQPSAREVDRG